MKLEQITKKELQELHKAKKVNRLLTVWHKKLKDVVEFVSKLDVSELDGVEVQYCDMSNKANEVVCTVFKHEQNGKTLYFLLTVYDNKNHILPSEKTITENVVVFILK